MTGGRPGTVHRAAGGSGDGLGPPTGTDGLHAMFVHAHPDDESSKGAATMARYRREGYRISVVTCTDGVRGDVLNPAMDRPGVRERLGEIRREELARALATLGVDDHFELGYRDSGYAEDPEREDPPPEPDSFYAAALDEATERLVTIVRAERPDVLVTYPPGGDYPHRDHIRCHDVSVSAFAAAADPVRYPDAGPPWQVRKLYHVGVFSRRKVEALQAACLERGIASPFAGWADPLPAEDADAITTSVEVGDYLAARSQALLAHATQIDPQGPWFLPSDEVVREVYPYEDFVLARSLVPTDLPEDSLFAGLEPVGSATARVGVARAAPAGDAGAWPAVARFAPFGLRARRPLLAPPANGGGACRARRGGRAAVWFAPG